MADVTMTDNRKPDFKALAKDLCEDPANMIYTILLRHKTAELEEWYEQIQRRNQRIRELKGLLFRASPYIATLIKRLPADDVDSRELLKAINEALDHDTD